MSTASVQAVSQAIPFTFEEEAHLYRHAETKCPILSVTQVIDSVGIVDYANAPEEALNWKSQLGTAAHAAINMLLTPDKGELDWDLVDPRVVPYVVAAELFLSEMNFVVQKTEWRGCVKLPQGPVGFQSDLIGLLNGELSAIVEWKCALNEERSWRVQMAGYEECILAMGEKPQGARTFKKIACQLRRDGKYKTHVYEDRVDKNVWQYSLWLATWKQNNGYRLEKR